jgi:hypothetical protein
MDMNLNNNAYTNVYNRGKNSDSKIVDTHMGIPQGIKEKRKNKIIILS